MTRIPQVALTLAALSLTLVALACSEDDGSGDGGGTSSTPTGPTFAFGLAAETLAGGGSADAVSAIEFAPDGRIFYTEQFEGAVRIINADGTLQDEPFVQVEVADWLGLDWGLTGLALDPDFETNGFVYLFYTEELRTETSTQGEVPIGRPVIVRFTDDGGTGTEETRIVEDLPETDAGHPGYNVNGDLHFGPDGALYASLGDYDLFEVSPEVIQDLATPIGKLLRMNPDGTAPEDNPFIDDPTADARVFASGFREPFPFTFADDGTIYGTDNTTVSCEELNIIVPGGNYGWPEMGEFPFADCAAAPGEQPIHHFTREGKAQGDFLSFVEVSGLDFLTDTVYAQLTDGLIACESQRSAVDNVVTAGVLRRLVISGGTVSASDQIVNECKDDAAVNEGQIYYSTASELKRLTDTTPATAGGTTSGNQIPTISQ
jgi:glucose/arabinose dehydrogenase